MSNPQPHVAEKSATYEIREQLERSTLWPRVPFTKAIDLNPKPERGSLSDEVQVSFVPMAAVEAGTGAIDASAVRKYAEVKKGYTYFREGDVLFAKITPCMENGKMAVARQLRNGIGFGSTEFHVLRPREGVDAHYVYHYVSSARFRAEAAHHMTGAVGQKRVPAAFLEQSEIPLPPIDEQRCIVAEIEKQFSRLDEAVANLKRVKANLKRYKTAVLKAAVEGRLVPTEAEIAHREGCSYETGAQLLQRILETRRSQWKGKGKYKEPVAADMIELPEGWACASVAQLSHKVQYGHTASAVVKQTGIRFLRITDIQDDRVDWSMVPSCDVSTEKADELRLKPGDIVFARTGATVGKSFQLLLPFPDSVFASYLIRISPADMHLSSWLYMFFQSSAYWAQIRDSAAGIGQPNVNGSKLQALRVQLPPLAEQQRIVAEVDRRLSITREMETEVAANLQRAERLRSAILTRVFAMSDEQA